MAKMTGARFLAESLDSCGVTHFFYMPTILCNTLVEMEMHTSIKRIMTHGEKSAAYMADGYARASGRIGFCAAQTVGASNLAAGLKDAFLANSPVVAFTGGPYEHTRNRRTYQQIDDFELFRPLTKYQARVTLPEDLPHALSQSMRAATTGTPGPTVIELHGHFGEIEEEQITAVILDDSRFAVNCPFRPIPDRESVDKVLQLLNQAERPIIVAGGGVRTADAGRELTTLAERLGIPVATSLNAKAVIAGDHPHLAGVSGLYSRESANRAVLEADLVFFIGSHTGSQVTCNHQVPSPGTPVIQLDINGEELGRHYENTASMCCDAKAGLQCLLDARDNDEAHGRESWLDRVNQLGQEWRQKIAKEYESDASPLRPERLCAELTQHLPDDALLVAETGYNGIWTGAFVDLTKPGQDYIRAAGSLGWGLPAAMGAQCALGDNRPVVLFTGDGGIWYHIAELETAAHWQIPLVILVANNVSMNEELEVYIPAYGGKLRGKHAELWQFTDVEFVDVAKSMGVDGLKVTRPGDFPGALEQALQAKAPFVLDVRTDMDAFAPAAFTG